MKNLIVFLSLILSFAATANVDSFETFHDSIQEGKVEAAYLEMLRADLEKAEITFEEKAQNMPKPFSDTEGKIQAAMLSMIEFEFEKAAILFEALENANTIDDASTLELREKTALILELITEL